LWISSRHVFNCVEKLNQRYTRLKVLYPLLNYSSTIRTKFSLLLYRYRNKRSVNSLSTPCMGNCLKNKSYKKLQTLKNKFLRIALKAPWFLKNKRLHSYTSLACLSIWITQQFKNFHENFTKLTKHSTIKLAAEDPPI